MSIVKDDLQGRYEGLSVAEMEKLLGAAINAELTVKKKRAVFVAYLHDNGIRPEFLTNAKGIKQGEESQVDKALVGTLEKVYNAKMLTADERKLLTRPTKSLSEAEEKARDSIKNDRNNWFKAICRELAKLIGSPVYAVNVVKQAPSPQVPDATKVSNTDKPDYQTAELMVTNVINWAQKLESASFDIVAFVKALESAKVIPANHK